MSTLKKRAVWLVVIVLTIAVFTIVRMPNEESVMREFYSGSGRAEDQLIDPLILHSDLVADRVTREILDPQMPNRRYAIRFLGNERVRSAMGNLKELLHDEGETNFYRADALQAIYLIDPVEARKEATAFEHEEELLGETAVSILNGTIRVRVRSKLEAATNYHE